MPDKKFQLLLLSCSAGQNTGCATYFRKQSKNVPLVIWTQTDWSNETVITCCFKVNQISFKIIKYTPYDTVIFKDSFSIHSIELQPTLQKTTSCLSYSPGKQFIPWVFCTFCYGTPHWIKHLYQNVLGMW